MITASLLAEDVQTFINQNIEADVTVLALQKNKFPGSDWTAILNQIAAKQKAKTKLATWFNTPNIIYPAKISIEQTSSEKTALHKSHLVSGENLIDLSGGFGVDDYYFAKKMKQVIHCEINAELSAIVKHNYEALGITNVQCLAGDSLETLRQAKQQFDWIYIDPSRRNDAKGKVFLLKDCLPNVLELLDFYFQFAANVMIKTAPILDIAAGASELQNVAAIHIVAIENEVKELLWILKKDFNQATKIYATNLIKNNTEVVTFTLNQPGNTVAYSLPKKYLYEPNAAIMKSGCFDAVSQQFNIEKLQQHSHLYTSDERIDFPGRIFEIEKCIGYNKSGMKQFLENTKANITTRNFPDSVETIRKKWKIKDGGNRYCFFTTDVNNNKIVLLCSKIE
jgi:hypothetical protein